MRHSRHAQPLRAAGRGDRGLGLVHLRPRLARGVPRDAPVALAEGEDASTGDDILAPARRARSTSATTTTSTAARSACAATWSRSSRAAEERRRSASSCSATRSRPSHRIDPLKGQALERVDRVAIYPASHYVTPGRAARATRWRPSRWSSRERLTVLARRAIACSRRQRLEQRTLFDLEMLREIGYCHGIENYSRHLPGAGAGRAAADAASTTCPKDALMIIDESHAAVPQVRAMYHGDRLAQGDARRVRLPPARRRSTTGRSTSTSSTRRGRPGASTCSATPGGLRAARRPAAPWPSRSSGPTGLMDPHDHGAPGRRARSTTCWTRSAPARERDERVLVTTLTKRMAEDLTEYYHRLGVRVRYLHSDIDTLERVADHPRPPARRVRRPDRHQPAPRGPRHARRCRWSPSSTPTRRATCARRPRLDPDRRAAPPATSAARSSCTRTRSRTRCGSRSGRRSGAA